MKLHSMGVMVSVYIPGLAIWTSVSLLTLVCRRSAGGECVSLCVQERKWEESHVPLISGTPLGVSLPQLYSDVIVTSDDIIESVCMIWEDLLSDFLR